jgi:chromosome segregation ATPase
MLFSVNVLTESKDRIKNLNQGNSNQLAEHMEREIELNILKEQSQQLQLDNEELQRRLITMERLSEENSKLRRVKEELRSSLNVAQEDISVLLKEKRILQGSIEDLQNQLSASSGFGATSRGSMWLNKR